MTAFTIDLHVLDPCRPFPWTTV